MDLPEKYTTINLLEQQSLRDFVYLIKNNAHLDVIKVIKHDLSNLNEDEFSNIIILLLDTLDNNHQFITIYLPHILYLSAKKDYISIIEFLYNDILPSEVHLNESDLITIIQKAMKNNHIEYLRFILHKHIQSISSNGRVILLEKAVTTGALHSIRTMLNLEHFQLTATDSAAHFFNEIQLGLIRSPFMFEMILEQFMKIEAFSHYVDKAQKRITALYETIDPENLPFGPLNKSISTKQIEWLGKFCLEKPEDCHFFIKNHEFYVVINKITLNISRLISQAELSHIFLNEDDSDNFILLSDLPEDDLLPFERPLPTDYTLAGKKLTTAERFLIYDYSDFYYDFINASLHGHPPPELKDSNDIFHFFIAILFISSGLNKIKPDWTGDPELTNINTHTFRGEKHITDIELKERVRQLQEKPKGFIQTQRGFCSTSVDADIAAKFEAHIGKIEYSDCYGKNIKPLAKIQEENEYLQLPGKIHIFSMSKNDHIYTFKAKSICPLSPQKRSVQQEYLFNQFLSKNLFENDPSPYLEGLLEECQYVYDKYLSKPFIENWLLTDWKLTTHMGEIYRPNHGLAHIMRVANLVYIVAQFLMHYGVFHFTERELIITQLTALFSVVERQNEAGFMTETPENARGYFDFKSDSANAFIHFTSQNCFLHMTKNEIYAYADNILEMGNSEKNSPTAILLTLAHKLDLLRCYSDKERVKSSIFDALNKYMPECAVEKLMDYAETLLHATGDRVLFGKKTSDYKPDLFYATSTNVTACFNAINSVDMPQAEFTAPLCL